MAKVLIEIEFFECGTEKLQIYHSKLLRKLSIYSFSFMVIWNDLFQKKYFFASEKQELTYFPIQKKTHLQNTKNIGRKFKF